MRAVCSEELNEYATGRVNFYFIVTLLLPFAVITLFSFFLWRYNQKIEESLNKQSNIDNLAGVVLTGITLMIYVIIMDICAVYYASTDHEYKDTTLSSKLNLNVTYITFVFDTAVVVYSVVICFIHFFSYSYCFRSYRECISKCCCIPFFYLMSGFNKKDELWSDNTEPNKRNICIFISLLYPTVFCISSHLGYIFVAWVTEPDRTSSIVLVALVILLYFFLMYREIYHVNIPPKDAKCHMRYMSVCAKIKHILEIGVSYYKSCPKKSEKPSFELITNSVPYSSFQDSNDKVLCNLNALLIALSWGPVFIVPVSVILAAFLLLPIPALELASYLQSIVEIVLVLAAALVSYKILPFQDSDATNFLKNFRKSYKGSSDDHSVGDEYEKSGRILGTNFKIVVDKL